MPARVPTCCAQPARASAGRAPVTPGRVDAALGGGRPDGAGMLGGPVEPVGPATAGGPAGRAPGTPGRVAAALGVGRPDAAGMLGGPVEPVGAASAGGAAS